MLFSYQSVLCSQVSTWCILHTKYSSEIVYVSTKSFSIIFLIRYFEIFALKGTKMYLYPIVLFFLSHVTPFVRYY